MLLDSEFTIAKIRKQQMNEYCEMAKRDSMLAKRQPSRVGPVLKAAYGSLHQLGHLLLAVGKRLDEMEVPPIPIGSIATSRQ